MFYRFVKRFAEKIRSRNGIPIQSSQKCIGGVDRIFSHLIAVVGILQRAVGGNFYKSRGRVEDQKLFTIGFEGVVDLGGNTEQLAVVTRAAVIDLHVPTNAAETGHGDAKHANTGKNSVFVKDPVVAAIDAGDHTGVVDLTVGGQSERVAVGFPKYR